MSDFATSLGTQGFSAQYNVQNQLSAGNADNQITSGDLNLYNQFSIWQAGTQLSAEETAMIYIEQGLFDDFDEALEEAKSTALDFSINEEGKTYGEQIETLAQQHLEAYDVSEIDGKISFEEFVQEEVNEYNDKFGDIDGNLNADDEMIQGIFQASFDFMDLNGDETIDANEIKAYYIAADILDAADNLPENSADAMDGVIKFSTVDKMSDIISIQAEEGTQEAKTRSSLKSALVQIYETLAPQESLPVKDQTLPDEQPANLEQDQDNNSKMPVMPFECGEPTAKGKAIIMIEKSLFSSNLFGN